MTLIEHPGFSYRGYDVKITQEITPCDNTIFKVYAGEEIVTMSGPWENSEKRFTRVKFHSDKVEATPWGAIKLPGHISYLGAEALGYLIETGIIDTYVSSEYRSPGTNKGLNRIARRANIVEEPGDGGRTRILRRRPGLA